MKLYFRLLGYVRPYLGIFSLSILGYVIFASTQPMLAHLFKYFLDRLHAPDGGAFLGVPLMYGVPVALILIAI